jgi:hypothetical protein
MFFLHLTPPVFPSFLVLQQKFRSKSVITAVFYLLATSSRLALGSSLFYHCFGLNCTRCGSMRGAKVGGERNENPAFLSAWTRKRPNSHRTTQKTGARKKK